jgi:hypothetical protein
MIPRNLFRPIVLGFSLALIAFGSIIPARTETSPVSQSANHIFTKALCFSEPDKPVVYFSKIFDVDITVPTIDTQPLVNGFIIHLKEKYDYQTNANYPVACPLYKTLSEAEAGKRKLQAQAQPTAKQIIEVDWTPPAWAQPLQAVGGPGYFPSAPLIPTHTFCAVGHESMMYFSAVFDTVGALGMKTWNDGFSGFLSKKYGIVPEVEATCTILNTVREAERNLNARVAGVRANNHKAVETGWKFDPAGSYKPAPKPTPKIDDDPEPVFTAPKQPRPAVPATSENIRDFATKEVPVALAYCQNDRVMSGAFDCYCVQRNVYNYRMEHAGAPPEPLTSLLAGDKLDCSSCIRDDLVRMWATGAAQSRGLVQSQAECAGRRFLTSLHAQPYLSHAKDLFNAAVAACKK